MKLRRDCEEVLKAVPCTVRSGNAVEDDTKVMLSGAAGFDLAIFFSFLSLQAVSMAYLHSPPVFLIIQPFTSEMWYNR